MVPAVEHMPCCLQIIKKLLFVFLHGDSAVLHVLELSTFMHFLLCADRELVTLDLCQSLVLISTTCLILPFFSPNHPPPLPSHLISSGPPNRYLTPSSTLLCSPLSSSSSCLILTCDLSAPAPPPPPPSLRPSQTWQCSYQIRSPSSCT